MKDLTITSSPNLNLVCNTGADKSYPCHVTLFLQFPTFERTIILQKMAMSWLVSAIAFHALTSIALTFFIAGCSCIGRRILFFCTVLELDNFGAGWFDLMIDGNSS